MTTNTSAGRIQEIAAQLSADGAEVTVTAVRQTMDGRESYSKVFHALEEWKLTRPRPPLLVDAPVLEDVEETLKSVLHVIWHAGAIEARAELQRLRAEAQHAVVELRRDLDDALQEISRLENDVAFHARKLDEQSISLQKAEAALTTRETEVGALRQQLTETSQQQRNLIDRIERLATRAATAETALRNNRQVQPHTHEAFDQNGPTPH